MKFKGEIWRDDLRIEHYEFEADSREKAIEFMEECRSAKFKGRGKSKAVGIVLRRIYWKIPWFAFYVSFQGKEMK